MEFHNGIERRKLNSTWKRLRIQYREAGMSEEAIQSMYEYDLSVLNSERAYISHTVKICEPSDEDTGGASERKQFERAAAVVDIYHETKTQFAWVGEIKDERLSAGLEKLTKEDLELLTLYIYKGYTELEISKAYNLSQPAIHKRIKKITLFLKNI